MRYLRGHLLGRRLISEDDLHLFRVTQDVGEAVEGIVRFYRVYHSSRYVGKTLVLRLHSPLPRAAVERIGREFRDILTGPLTQGGPSPEEGDPPELPLLPRLFVPFDRRHYGRLRLFIDAVNAAGAADNPHPARRDALPARSIASRPAERLPGR